MGLIQNGQWVDQWYDTKTVAVSSVAKTAVLEVG